MYVVLLENDTLVSNEALIMTVVGLVITSFVSFLCSDIISLCAATKAPSFIHPCNTTNPVCLTQATRDAIPGFVKGIPELNIPSLDPFFITELNMQLPGGLTFTFYNGRAVGLRKCIVNNVTAEVGVYQNLDIICSLTITGKYKANGRILLFPINGAGDAKIKIVNMAIKMYHKTRLFTDDQGVHHIASNGFTYDLDYGDKVSFTLSDLFKGNPELSQTVVTFLNQNWRLVVGEFGKPIVDYALNLADKTVNAFFLAVPYEDIIHVPFGVRTQ